MSDTDGACQGCGAKVIGNAIHIQRRHEFEAFTIFGPELDAWHPQCYSERQAITEPSWQPDAWR